MSNEKTIAIHCDDEEAALIQHFNVMREQRQNVIDFNTAKGRFEELTEKYRYPDDDFEL